MAVIPLAARARLLLELEIPEGGEPSSGDTAPEAVRAAAGEALERGETHYTDRPGILPLRERVSAWLEAACGVPSDPRRDVVITCGATEARFVAVQQLLEPGRSLLCLGACERVAGALVVRGAELLVAADGPPAEALERVAALYLPAGGVAAGERERWLREAKARGWWVIFELAAGTVADHPGADPALRPRTVTVGGIGADAGLESWRVGFLIAPAESAPDLRSFKQALTICTTNLSQWAALPLFEGEP